MPTLPKVTIGLDLGDRVSDYAILNARGQVVERGRVPTDRAGLSAWLAGVPRALVVFEVGTHSPWVSRLVKNSGIPRSSRMPERSRRLPRPLKRVTRWMPKRWRGWGGPIRSCWPR